MPSHGPTLDDRRADSFFHHGLRLLLFEVSLHALDSLRRDRAHVILGVGHADRLQQRDERLVLEPEVSCDLVYTHLGRHPASDETVRRALLAGAFGSESIVQSIILRISFASP